MTSRNRPARRPQAIRRAETREALLQATAVGIARHGYAGLSLERVARDAGYSRGAVYHQFADKEALTLAVVDWVASRWDAQVGHLMSGSTDPTVLFAVARAHAVFCRRDIARTMLVLQIEFSGTDHSIGRALRAATERLLARVAALVSAGQRTGTIPSTPPADEVALAVIGALESVVINLAGRSPHDEVLAERSVRGLLCMER